MPTTPTYAWPYQSLTDPPDGPNLGEDLALAIEATVAAQVAALTASIAAQVAVVVAAAAARTPVAAVVPTPQATTSTSYTDLATVGPSVTVTTGTSALVSLGSQIHNTASGITAYMSVAVAGATIAGAVDYRSVGIANANSLILASRTFLVAGLVAGVNVFTAKYKVNGASTGTFSDRELIVTPI